MTKKIDVTPNGKVTLYQAVQQIDPNGEIIIHPGIHLLDQTIKITKPLTIKNASEEQEDLTLTVVGKSAILVDLPSFPQTEKKFDLETLNPNDVIGNVLLDGLTIVSQEGDGTTEFNDYPSAVNVVSGRLILKNCNITSAERSGCSVRSDHAQIIVDHCEIHDTKDGGIFFDNYGCGRIQDCVIGDTGLSCIDAEEGGNFMASNCKIFAGDFACVTLHDQGNGLCSDSILIGNSFVNAIVISDDSNGNFINCEIHETNSEKITEWQSDKETFSDCNFIPRDHDDASEQEVEYTDEEYEESARIKDELMKTILGPPYDLVQHAIIPYCVGGTLDLYYYPTKNGTALATQELANPYFDKPYNRDMNAYELAMISRHPFDLKKLEINGADLESNNDAIADSDNSDNDDLVQEESDLSPFEKDNEHFNTVLNMLARYIETGAKLNHGDTLEFPADFENEDVAGRCFIISRYGDPVKIPDSNQKFGIMVAIEIFHSEMRFAMQSNGKGETLLEMLKEAGIGLVSDLNRPSLIPSENDDAPKDKPLKTIPTKEEVRNIVLEHLSKQNSKIVKKIAGLQKISFAPEVKKLIFECFPDPPFLGIMLYVVNENGDEVFCNDPQISPINCNLEILDDASYLNESEWDNEEFIDAFPDRFYDCLFAEWFHQVWEKAGGERLPFRSLFTIHDDDNAFDLKKNQWLKDDQEYDLNDEDYDDENQDDIKDYEDNIDNNDDLTDPEEDIEEIRENDAEENEEKNDPYLKLSSNGVPLVNHCVVPDDYATLSEAIEATRSGGIIEVKSGVYHLSDTLVMKMGQTLRGLGEKAEEVQITTNDQSVIRIPQGGTLENIFINETGTDPDIYEQRGSIGSTAVLGGTLHIQNCRISSTTHSGIMVRGKKARLNMKNCHVFQTAGGGVFFDHGSSGTIEDSSIGKNGFAGVDADEDSRVTVRRTKIDGDLFSCVCAHSGGRIDLEDVEACNGLDFCVLIMYKGEVRMERSLISECQSTGIMVLNHSKLIASHCRIINNIIGIHSLLDSQIKIDSCQIENNCREALYICSDTKAEINNCDLGKRGDCAVRLFQSRNFVLFNNCRIHDCDLTAFVLYNTHNVGMINCEIYNVPQLFAAQENETKNITQKDCSVQLIPQSNDELNWFWNKIVMGYIDNDFNDFIDPISRILAQESDEMIFKFDDILAGLLHQLDKKELQRDRSPKDFLNYRAFIVSFGKGVYQKFLNGEQVNLSNDNSSISIFNIAQRAWKIKHGMKAKYPHKIKYDNKTMNDK